MTILSARHHRDTGAARSRAQDLEAIRDAMLQDLNTSFRGGHVFGGAAGTTPPYAKNNPGVVSAYQGSTVEVSVDINKEHEVAVAFNGESLARGTDADDIFVVLDRAIAAVRAGDEPRCATQAQRARRRVRSGDGVAEPRRRFAPLGRRRRAAARRGRRAATRAVSTLEEANMAAAISGHDAG